MSQFFTRLRAFVAVPFLLVSAAALADATSPSSPNPTLASYVEAVLRTHPELKVADANVAAAQAKADGLALPIYNPELNADAQRSQSDAYSIGLSQALDVSGKRSARRLSGQKQLQQAVAERAALRQQLATGVLSGLTTKPSGLCWGWCNNGWSCFNASPPSPTSNTKRATTAFSTATSATSHWQKASPSPVVPSWSSWRRAAS
jgi:Outer membrane efflux protein